MINTFIAPVELSWKLGDRGLHVKTGLGMYVPDGTVTGVNGLGNVGNAWWTFMPEFVVSYLKDGWNLTANIFEEINTKSTVTGIAAVTFCTRNLPRPRPSANGRLDQWLTMRDKLVTTSPVHFMAGLSMSIDTISGRWALHSVTTLDPRSQPFGCWMKFPQTLRAAHRSSRPDRQSPRASVHLRNSHTVSGLLTSAWRRPSPRSITNSLKI
jgi:hypothetical protein